MGKRKVLFVIVLSCHKMINVHIYSDDLSYSTLAWHQTWYSNPLPLTIPCTLQGSIKQRQSGRARGKPTIVSQIYYITCVTHF